MRGDNLSEDINCWSIGPSYSNYSGKCRRQEDKTYPEILNGIGIVVNDSEACRNSCSLNYYCKGF